MCYLSTHTYIHIVLYYNNFTQLTHALVTHAKMEELANRMQMVTPASVAQDLMATTVRLVRVYISEFYFFNNYTHL